MCIIDHNFVSTFHRHECVVATGMRKSDRGTMGLGTK